MNLHDWLKPYRDKMEERYTRLDDLLETLQNKEQDNDSES